VQGRTEGRQGDSGFGKTLKTPVEEEEIGRPEVTGLGFVMSREHVGRARKITGNRARRARLRPPTTDPGAPQAGVCTSSDRALVLGENREGPAAGLHRAVRAGD